MGDTLKLGFVLTVICVIAAGSLAKVYDVTSVIIKRMRRNWMRRRGRRSSLRPPFLRKDR